MATTKRKRRAGTKAFDTWKYGPDKNGRAFDIDVVTVTEHGISSLTVNGAPTMRFEATVEELGICVQDSDINTLRQSVHEAIRKQVDVTWKRWLRVRTSGSGAWHERRDHHWALDRDGVKPPEAREHPVQRISLTIEVLHFDFGTTGGKKVHRDYEHDRQGGRAYDGWPESDERRSTYRGVETFIEYTPETADALGKVFELVGRVNEMLESILSPDRLTQTLEGIRNGSALALPAPSAEPVPSDDPDFVETEARTITLGEFAQRCEDEDSE